MHKDKLPLASLAKLAILVTDKYLVAPLSKLSRDELSVSKLLIVASLACAEKLSE